MNSSGRARMDVAMRETTRRVARKLPEGAALLAVAGAGSGRAALAQGASPVASPAGGNDLNGKYVVIRIRTVKPDQWLDEPDRADPGGVRPAGGRASPDSSGTSRGRTRRHRSSFRWVSLRTRRAPPNPTGARRSGGKLDAADFVEGDPDVYEGEIGVATESSGAAVSGSPEVLPPTGGLVGNYAVIRLRQPNPDWPVAEVMALIGEGYVPLVREIPGSCCISGARIRCPALKRMWGCSPTRRVG